MSQTKRWAEVSNELAGALENCTENLMEQLGLSSRMVHRYAAEISSLATVITAECLADTATPGEEGYA